MRCDVCKDASVHSRLGKILGQDVAVNVEFGYFAFSNITFLCLCALLYCSAPMCTYAPSTVPAPTLFVCTWKYNITVCPLKVGGVGPDVCHASSCSGLGCAAYPNAECSIPQCGPDCTPKFTVSGHEVNCSLPTTCKDDQGISRPVSGFSMR